MTAPRRVHAWSGRFVAAAVLQVPAGVTVLTVVMGIGTVDGLAICFSATSTPMALFIDWASSRAASRRGLSRRPAS